MKESVLRGFSEIKKLMVKGLAAIVGLYVGAVALEVLSQKGLDPESVARMVIALIS